MLAVCINAVLGDDRACGAPRTEVIEGSYI